MGILLQKRPLYAAQLSSRAHCTVAVIGPIPPNLVQPITAQGFTSEMTVGSGVRWPTQPSISSACSGQTSWVRANIWESIRNNAQGCTQQQARCKNNQASNISTSKTTTIMAFLPRQRKRYTTSAFFAASVRKKAGNQDHASLIWILLKWAILSDWGAALGQTKLVKATCSQSTGQKVQIFSVVQC